MSLKSIAKKFESKLKKIKVVIFDLDGILTDAHVWWASEEVGFNRTFNIYDGYGMKVLMKAGLKVGVITGGNSVSVQKRVEQLGLNFCYAGNEDKRAAFVDVLKKYNVEADEVLYMGDELFDIPLLKKSGFSATVPNTSVLSKSTARSFRPLFKELKSPFSAISLATRTCHFPDTGDPVTSDNLSSIKLDEISSDKSLDKLIKSKSGLSAMNVSMLAASIFDTPSVIKHTSTLETS